MGGDLGVNSFVAPESETSSDFQPLQSLFLDSLVALVVAYRLFSSCVPTG